MLRVVDLGRIVYEFKCKFLRSDMFNYTLYVMTQTLIGKTLLFFFFLLGSPLQICIYALNGTYLGVQYSSSLFNSLQGSSFLPSGTEIQTPKWSKS